MYLLDKKPKLISFSYFSIFLSLVLAVFFYHFLNLSVFQNTYYFEKSLSNLYSQNYKIASRGSILDQRNKVIAHNDFVNRLYLTNSKSSEEITQIKNKLNNLEIKLTDAFVRYDGYKSQQESSFEKILISEELKDLDLKELLSDHKGLVLSQDIERKVEFPLAFAHVIGYLGFPSEEEIGQLDILPFSKIGKAGIEKYYDTYLRGEDGVELIRKDEDGGVVSYTKKKPLDGSDVILSVDSLWQEKLYALLEENVNRFEALGAGAVIIQTDTGRVLALASYPSYDINLFSKGLSEDMHQDILNDPAKPLLNRVIQTQFSPGSTFKPIVAFSALRNGIVDDNYIYDSQGCIQLGDNRFCEADSRVLGSVDIYSAISRSSNLYFCHIARLFDEKYGNNQGIRYIVETADQFMLEQKSGIDLDYEISGSMATPEDLFSIEDRAWSIGDTCNTIIGQGYVSQTPIRMALVAGAIKNHGSIYKPYIVSEIRNTNDEILFENTPEVVGRIEGSDESFEIVNKAMRWTVNDVQGSGRLLSELSIPVDIKTGSADATEVLSNGKVRTGAHSWIIGSFEFEEKDYSFSIVSQYGGRGYQAMPIIANFLNCLEQNFSQDCTQRF